jgi:hypothetical protein
MVKLSLIKALSSRTDRGHVAYARRDPRTGKTVQVRAKAGVRKQSVLDKVKRRAPGKGERVDLTKAELQELLATGRFALVSAGPNPKVDADKNLSEQEVKERHTQLGNQLRDAGYCYTNVTGHYGGIEDSYLVMVHDAERDDVRKLGETFHQDSVIYAEHGKWEMHYTFGEHAERNEMHVGEGWQEVPDADDFFTVVRHPDGTTTKFTLNFDFDNYVKWKALMNLLKKGGMTMGPRGREAVSTPAPAPAPAAKPAAPAPTTGVSISSPGGMGRVARPSTPTKPQVTKAMRQASLLAPQRRVAHGYAHNDYGSDADDTAEETAAPKAVGTPKPSQQAGTVVARKPQVAKALDGFSPAVAITPRPEVLHDPAKEEAAAEGEKDDKKPDVKKALKSGEGSRGGKVIGHTKSGKPVYGPKGKLPTSKAAVQKMAKAQAKKDSKGWTGRDHLDAKKIHATHAKKLAGKKNSWDTAAPSPERWFHEAAKSHHHSEGFGSQGGGLTDPSYMRRMGYVGKSTDSGNTAHNHNTENDMSNIEDLFKSELGGADTVKKGGLGTHFVADDNDQPSSGGSGQVESSRPGAGIPDQTEVAPLLKGLKGPEAGDDESFLITKGEMASMGMDVTDLAGEKENTFFVITKGETLRCTGSEENIAYLRNRKETLAKSLGGRNAPTVQKAVPDSRTATDGPAHALYSPRAGGVVDPHGRALVEWVDNGEDARIARHIEESGGYGVGHDESIRTRGRGEY